MRGVFFDDRVAPVARSPYRADVALFVGFVDRRRGKHLPDHDPHDEQLAQTIIEGNPQLYRWLVKEGWARGNPTLDREKKIDELIDIPVPIDRIETFDRLFAGDLRPWGDDAQHLHCDTYLRAAVRSFFVQGGRLCYVVRVGTPPRAAATRSEVDAAIAERSARLAALLPSDPSAVDRATWRGVWTLFGLPDVSFVCLPDLPEIVRGPLPEEAAPLPRPEPPVAFEECSIPATTEVPERQIRELFGPSSDDAGYAAWAAQLRTLVEQVSAPRSAGSLREVQIIAAIPRPSDERIGADLLAQLRSLGIVNSAFLQLVYPWLATKFSDDLPDGLEPPDGTLCGVLARNALARGTYRSVANQQLVLVTDARPSLQGRDLSDPADLSTLGAHVTLLGHGPAGFVVLSDVTMSSEPTFRLAHANRLVSALVRALRLIGEEHAFEPSNERLWESLVERSRLVLDEFWHAGALRGETRGEAFSVRCDRSTMTQDDLDAGRVIVMVEVALTVSIQRINVMLTRTRDGLQLERAA